MKKIILFIAMAIVTFTFSLSANPDNPAKTPDGTKAINTWTGSASQYWNNNGNWSLGHIPTSTEDVVIPAGTGPRISMGNAVCNKLTIQAGANIKVYAKTLTINDVFDIYGSLRLLDNTSKVKAMFSVFCRNGSTALVTKDQAMIEAYGDWIFFAGANFNPTKGFVDFSGSGNRNLTCNSSTSSFCKVRIYNTLSYSSLSDEDLHINEFLFIYSGASFISKSDHDIYLHGNFNYYGTFDFTQNSNTGSVIMDAVNINKYASGSGVFNNLEFNSTTGSTTNADITVKGHLTFQAGTFDCNSHNIYLEGYWLNNASNNAFVAGTGKVFFSAPTDWQIISGLPTTFYDVEIYNSSAYREIQINCSATIHDLLLNDAFCVSSSDLDITGTLNMNSADCLLKVGLGTNINIHSLDQGGSIYALSTSTIININDLVENGLYGTYYLNHGEINIAQNSGGGLHLNADINISDGTMNLIGSGNSYWPNGGDASLIMSGGTLDVKDHKIVIVNNAQTLNDNITGGTIRSAGGILGQRPDFTPLHGTFEFYGSANPPLGTMSGCKLHDVEINMTAKSGEIHLNNNFAVGNKLEIIAGDLELNDKTLDVEGNLIVDGGAALSIEEGECNVDGIIWIYGQLNMNHNDGVVNANSDFIWENGSTANITAYQTIINAYGNFRFEPGSNANLTNGFVDFRGTYIKLLTTNSPTSSLSKVRFYKTIRYSSTSTDALKINDFVYIAAGGNFESWSNRNIYLHGDFRYYGTFDFTKNNNTGSVILDGVSFKRFGTGSGVLNNVVVDGGTSLTDYELHIAGDFTIDSGVFDCGAQTVYIAGDWINNVGTAAFLPATGTVTFNGDGEQSVTGNNSTNFGNVVETYGGASRELRFQKETDIVNLTINNKCKAYKNMNITGTLDIDDSDSEFIGVNSSTTVNINSLKQGNTLTCMAATININDLVESGIYGSYHLVSGTINIAQNSGGNLHLNGGLNIENGTMNINGTGTSRWAFASNAYITMSGGTLDFTNLTIDVYNSAHTFTENISGGTIRTAKGFFCHRTGFTPNAGTFEFYGSDNASLFQVAGSSLHDVIVDKTSKGTKSNLMYVASDCHITQDLDLKSGMLNIGNDITIDNDLIIRGGAECKIGEANCVVNHNVTNYGELQMTHNNSLLEVLNNMAWMNGSSSAISAAQAKIFVYGNWIANSGSNPDFAMGFVDFKGDSDSWITNHSTDAAFYKMRCYKDSGSGAKVKIHNNSNQDIEIKNFLYIANGNTFESYSDHDIELTGNFNYYGAFDFTKGAATSNFVFKGGNINQFGSGSGIFNNVIFDGGTTTTNYEIYIDGDLTIQSGVYDAGGQITNIGGDWTNNVGDAGFVEASSAVYFDGNSPSVIHTDEIFHNLTIVKTYPNYNGLTLSANKNITVGHNLNIVDGTMEINSGVHLNVDNNIVINSGAGINADDSSIEIAIGGNWTNNNTTNTYTQGYLAGTETVRFVGTGNQYVNTTAAQQKFGYLIIEKTSGEFKPNDNIYVIRDFELTNGIWADNVNGLSHSFGRNFIVDGGLFDVSTNKNTVNLVSDLPAHLEIAQGNGDLYNLNINKSNSKGEDKSIIVTMYSDIYCGAYGNTNIENGKLYINGFMFTSTGNLTIGDGGILEVVNGATLKVQEYKSLSVNDGGELRLLGSNIHPVTLTHYNPSGYQCIVNDGGKISAKYATIEYMDQNGIQLKFGSEVDATDSFNHCVFQHGSDLPNSTFFSVETDAGFTATDVEFINNNDDVTYNVRKIHNYGYAIFESPTGNFSGPEFEYDSYNRVHWNMDMEMHLWANLEGAYNGAGMNIDLRTNGVIPLSQPFNTAPWNYSGTESVSSIPGGVVDWVLIELRDADSPANANPASVVDTRAAFILSNGKVVDMSGNFLHYNLTYSKKLYPVIIHRNHIDVMSSSNIIRNSDIYIWNFKAANAAYGGANAEVEVSPGVWAMYAGDVSANNAVSTGDLSDWKDATGNAGYVGADLNLDAQVDNQDKNECWVPNYGQQTHVPTSK